MKLKKIIAAVLSCILIISLPITAVAAKKKLSSDMSMEDLQKFAKRNTYSYKIYEYEKENAEMQKDSKKNELEYFENLLSNISKSDEKYYEYKLKISELKKESELAKIDFEYYDKDKEGIDEMLLDLSLKSKYYDICLLNNQRKSQKLKVNYLKKYYEIESVKLESGQSTENEKQLAEISLGLAENELSAIKKSIKSKEREIADLLNQYDDTENFSVKCFLPEKISYQKFDAKKLWEKYTEKNFELKKERRSMEFDGDYLEEIKEIYGKDSDTYKSCKNSYEIDKLNFEIEEKSCKSQIAEIVSSYEQAFAEYLSCKEYSLVLKDKLDILKIAYETGNMSELEYLKQCSEISTEMCKADNALVQADLYYDRLCLIEKGLIQC